MSIPYFYHNSFSEIPHKGVTGNEYVLDAFLTSKKIVEGIKNESLGENFYKPAKNLPLVSESIFVHDEEYLQSLISGDPKSMAESSGVMYSPGNMTAYIHKSEASYQAFQHAKKNGFSYDLAGGTHHAGFFAGGGFGVINTVMNSIFRDLQKNPTAKFVIIDTDVHYGDGNASYVQIDERFQNVKLFDLYGYIIPRAKNTSISSLTERGNFIRKVTRENYFQELEKLPAFLKEHSPDLVIWLQGADIWNQSAKSIKDLGLTSAEILKRDKFIIDTLTKYKLPFVMNPAGGYINYKDEKNRKVTETEIEKQWNALVNIYLAPLRYLTKKK